MKTTQEKVSLDAAIKEAEAALGTDALQSELLRLARAKQTLDSTLTIIVNDGVHHLPDAFRRGHVHILSRGSLDFSSQSSTVDEFTKSLSNCATILKSSNWKKVYIVPFGPSVLSMLVKLLVYRITGLQSIEVMNMPNGSRCDIEIDLRLIAISS